MNPEHEVEQRVRLELHRVSNYLTVAFRGSDK